MAYHRCRRGAIRLVRKWWCRCPAPAIWSRQGRGPFPEGAIESSHREGIGNRDHRRDHRRRRSRGRRTRGKATLAPRSRDYRRRGAAPPERGPPCTTNDPSSPQRAGGCHRTHPRRRRSRWRRRSPGAGECTSRIPPSRVLILDLSLVTEQWASPKHKLVARR